MKGFAIGLVFLLGAAACAKDEVQVRTDENGKTVVIMDDDSPSDTIWHEAWQKISQGADKVAEAGKWTVHRAKDGAIVVGRKLKQVAGSAAEQVSDAAATANVKARLGSPGITVYVHDGIAELHGQVKSPGEAEKAIKVAMTSKGVDQVISYLEWSDE